MHRKGLPVTSFMAIAAVLWLPGCGMHVYHTSTSVHSHNSSLAQSTPTPSASSPAKESQSHPTLKNHTASHTPQTSKVSFPPLVATILSGMAGTTHASLWGPTVLPRGNSAKTSSTFGQFSAQIFACPTAEPVNGPKVGQLNCGTMASFAESFGSSVYSNNNAARETLPPPPVSGLSALPQTTQFLPGHLKAVRWYSGNPANSGTTVAIKWQEGDWTVWVYGGTGLWNTALMVTRELERYRLPAHLGIMIVDAAPDGQHTSLAWVVGNTVYRAGAMHQSLHAIVVAASMKNFSS